MSEAHVWDQEYKNGVFITKHTEPQKILKRFVRYLKKEHVQLEGSCMLDIGCGTGRNMKYFAERGARVVGYDISKVAIQEALINLRDYPNSKVVLGNIGAGFSEIANSFDLAIDIMTSQNLTEKERVVYIRELKRVLKPGAYILSKTLAKEGDKNARELLKKFPGSEIDTYTQPQTGITEKVFTEKNLRLLFDVHFRILSLEKTTHYARFDNRVYRRNYYELIAQKR